MSSICSLLVVLRGPSLSSLRVQSSNVTFVWRGRFAFGPFTVVGEPDR